MFDCGGTMVLRVNWTCAATVVGTAVLGYAIGYWVHAPPPPAFVTTSRLSSATAVQTPICNCWFGSPANDRDCTSHGLSRCIACDTGYYINSRKTQCCVSARHRRHRTSHKPVAPTCTQTPLDRDPKWTAFSDIVDVLNCLDAPWHIDFGTLLSFYRDCRLADKDIHVTIKLGWVQTNLAVRTCHAHMACQQIRMAGIY